MRYYKIVSDGRIKSIGTGAGEEEISEAEYNILLAQIREKASLVDKLYGGEITIDNIDPDWRNEIQRRFDERIAEVAAADQQDISAEEALDIILGGETT